MSRLVDGGVTMDGPAVSGCRLGVSSSVDGELVGKSSVVGMASLPLIGDSV